MCSLTEERSLKVGATIGGTAQVTVLKKRFFFFNCSHPDVFSLNYSRVSSVKTQLIYCKSINVLLHYQFEHFLIIFGYILIYINSLRGLSPQANYTDRAAAAVRRSKCQLLRIEGCHVVNATDPRGR